MFDDDFDDDLEWIKDGAEACYGKLQRGGIAFINGVIDGEPYECEDVEEMVADLSFVVESGPFKGSKMVQPTPLRLLNKDHFKEEAESVSK